MTTLTTRATKGSALTHNELDANFKRNTQTKAGNYTVVESDNRSPIDVTATATITLPDAATIVAAADTGDFEVTLNNTAANTLTVTCTTGTDTILGSTSDFVMTSINSVTLRVNQAGNGYNVVSSGITETSPTLNDPAITISGTGTIADSVNSTSIDAIYDEDTLVSDDPNGLATQQSIKAYADSVGAALDTQIASLNTKILTIGSEALDSGASFSVAHGVTLAKIRTISVLVMTDDESLYYDFSGTTESQSESAAEQNIIQASTSNIDIAVAIGGFFDTPNFNDNFITNRGWITIQYTD